MKKKTVKAIKDSVYQLLEAQEEGKCNCVPSIYELISELKGKIDEDEYNLLLQRIFDCAVDLRIKTHGCNCDKCKEDK